MGVLPGHTPVLSVMVEGVIDIQTVGGETWVAAVDAGFISVSNDRVSILAERAELSHEIDLEQARHELERLQAAGETTDAAQEHLRRAEARVRAVERAS